MVTLSFMFSILLIIAGIFMMAPGVAYVHDFISKRRELNEKKKIGQRVIDGWKYYQSQSSGKLSIPLEAVYSSILNTVVRFKLKRLFHIDFKCQGYRVKVRINGYLDNYVLYRKDTLSIYHGDSKEPTPWSDLHINDQVHIYNAMAKAFVEYLDGVVEKVDVVRLNFYPEHSAYSEKNFV